MKPLYTVMATGNTYPIKAELRLDWGFNYYAEEKAWMLKGADEGMCNLFKHKARGAEWEGVELTFTEEK